MEIDIRRPDGTSLAQGEAGEVTARGDNIMLGYWNKPEVTDAVLNDGWYVTKADVKGDLFVVGDGADAMPVLVVRLPGDLTEAERASFLAVLDDLRVDADLVAAGAPVLDAALAVASSEQGERLFAPR